MVGAHQHQMWVVDPWQEDVRKGSAHRHRSRTQACSFFKSPDQFVFGKRQTEGKMARSLMCDLVKMSAIRLGVDGRGFRNNMGQGDAVGQ